MPSVLPPLPSVASAKAKPWWTPQRTDELVTCPACSQAIEKWHVYMRLVFDPDGPDPLGEDRCMRCFKTTSKPSTV